MNTSPRNTALRLLALLRKHGPTTATNTTLAASLKVSPRAVNYAIAELAEAGQVTVERSTPHPTLSPSGRRLFITEGAKLPQLHGVTSDYAHNGEVTA